MLGWLRELRRRARVWPLTRPVGLREVPWWLFPPRHHHCRSQLVPVHLLSNAEIDRRLR